MTWRRDYGKIGGEREKISRGKRGRVDRVGGVWYNYREKGFEE
ncbi:hypothetical protein BREVNS_1304 [Brevinematales bacterium NS]|nr:hypothetical protein BREVNS_0733 [Brevinematales bacterium NS]QJR22054.1 hypothetical protein BREVNS_1304 [Brevinematales bacterium NS]